MTSDIQNYLSNMEDKFKSYQSQQPQSKTLNKVKDLNSSVLNQIGNQIIQSRIIIPQHQKKLKLKTLPAHNELQVSKIDSQFNQIKEKKKAILDELHQIQLMESSIKMSRSTLKHSTTSSHPLKRSMVKSQFTQQDLTKIRQIYKKQKKFKNKIEMGIKKYEEDLQKFKREKEDQQKEKHRQLCLQKHQQRQKYIQQTQKRNKQREQILKQQHQRILELKKKQKLFQKLQSKFLEQKQIQAEEMKQKLHEHKKKREFSFDDMKQHQEKYLERKRIEDEEREQKVRNFKNVNEPKFPCLFLDRIKDQKLRLRHESEEKKETIKTFVEKKSAFAEQVRKNLHQKIKTMSESKLTQMKQSMVSTSPKWLNTPQKYEEGTKYMREINAKIAKLPRKVVDKSDEEKKPRFKNYLNDLKALNQEKKNEAKQTSINNFVSHIGILEANQNITSHNLAKSIKAKIQLMNKLQQMQQ